MCHRRVVHQHRMIRIHPTIHDQYQAETILDELEYRVQSDQVKQFGFSSSNGCSYSISKHRTWEFIEKLTNLKNGYAIPGLQLAIKENDKETTSIHFPYKEDLCMERWLNTKELAEKKRQNRKITKKLPNTRRLCQPTRRQSVRPNPLDSDEEECDDHDYDNGDGDLVTEVSLKLAIEIDSTAKIKDTKPKQGNVESIDDDSATRPSSRPMGRRRKNKDYVHYKGIARNETSLYQRNYAEDIAWEISKTKKWIGGGNYRSSDPEKLGFTGAYAKTPRKPRRRSKRKIRTNIPEETPSIEISKAPEKKQQKQQVKKKNTEVTREKELIKKTSPVQLWHVIESVLEKNVNIQFSDCNAKKCSLSPAEIPYSAPTQAIHQDENPATDSNQAIPKPKPPSEPKPKVRRIRRLKVEDKSLKLDDETITLALEARNTDRPVSASPKLQLSRETTTESNTTNQSQAGSPIPCAEPLLVKIKSKGISPATLTRKFGDRYWEGKCWPRKVFIDISQDVMSVYDSTDDAVDLGFLAGIIIHFHPNSHRSIEVDQQTSESVYLDVKADLRNSDELHERLKIKSFIDYPIEKVIDLVVSAFKEFIPESLQKIASETSHCPAVDMVNRTHFDWLSSLCNWRYDIYTAVEARRMFRSQSAHKREGIVFQEKSSQENDLLPDLHKGIVVCDLCSDQETKLNKLVLKCGHGVCGDCFVKNWEKEKKWKQSVFRFKCPICSFTAIDPVSLLSLMSIHRLKSCYQEYEAYKIESHPQWKWCPKCGRTAKVAATDLLDVCVGIECLCGDAWCFMCGGVMHWPASCEQTKLHMSKVSDNNDLILKAKVHTSQEVSQDGGLCSYDVCMSCVGLDSKFNVLTDSSKGAILSALFMRSANNHLISRRGFQVNRMQTMAANSAKSFTKSNLRTSFQRPSPMRHSSRSISGVRGLLSSVSRSADSSPRLQQLSRDFVASKDLEIERLFLFTVFRFVHQCHFLLGHSYIVLSQKSDIRIEALARQVLKLEHIVHSLELILKNPEETGLVDMKEAMESGEHIRRAIVASVRQLQSMNKSSQSIGATRAMRGIHGTNAIALDKIRFSSLNGSGEVVLTKLQPPNVTRDASKDIASGQIRLPNLNRSRDIALEKIRLPNLNGDGSRDVALDRKRRARLSCNSKFLRARFMNEDRDTDLQNC